jgi:hypothetical protein
VLKKAGVAVGIATAALLAITPLAFADEDSPSGDGHGAHFQLMPGVQDHVFSHPYKFCNKSEYEGVKNYHSHDQENNDSHDGDCDQENEAHGFDD